MSRAWGFPSGSVKWVTYVQCGLSLRTQTGDSCLEILSHDAAAPGAWAGWPRLVSHNANSIALLLWIGWFCLVIILGGRTWKHWASASIAEMRCNSSELTLLLNKPTVGVRLLFPPSSIPKFRFSAVLTDIGDCIIAFSKKIRLVLCSQIMIYWREFSEGIGAFSVSITISSVFQIVHMPSSFSLVSFLLVKAPYCYCSHSNTKGQSSYLLKFQSFWYISAFLNLWV